MRYFTIAFIVFYATLANPHAILFAQTTFQVPVITVNSPNGGEIWGKGEQHQVRWVISKLASTSLSVELRRDGQFVDGLVGVSGNPPPSTFDWIIPDKASIVPGSGYTIRVLESNNPSNYDESDAPFSIVNSKVVPTLGVALDASTPASATVTAGATNVSFAKIKVTAGAQPVNTLNAIQVGSDSPNAVKVLTNFKIYDGPTLLSSSSLDLDYNGAYYYQWLKVSGFSIPANTSKTLTVVSDVKSGAPAGQVRLGIAGWNFDSPGALVEPFGTPLYGNQMSIVSTLPAVAVLSPNGGEVWRAGEIRRIAWKTEGLRLVRIYIEDAAIISSGAAIYITTNNEPVAATQGYYDWTIPPLSQLPGGVGSSNYRIRVVDYDNPNVSDLSDAPFTVSGTVIAKEVPVWSAGPMGPLVRGESYRFAGEVKNGVPNSRVVLYLQRPDGTFKYDDKFENDILVKGSNYTDDNGYWTLSANQTLTLEGQVGTWTSWVAVSGVASNRIQHTVVSPASTPPPLSLAVTSPRGGEVWEKGRTYALSWTYAGISFVNLSVFKDGVFVQYIAQNLPVDKNQNAASYQWVVPVNLAAGGGYQIYVNAPLEANATSAGNLFSIAGGPQPFAECLPDGTLIKMPGDPKVYVIEQCRKRWIQTADEFRREGYRWEKIQNIEPPVGEAYAETLKTRARVIKAIGDQRVYQVVEGKRLWIPSADAFQTLGFAWKDLVNVGKNELAKHPHAQLLRVKGDDRIFYITESGLKRHLTNPEVFRSYDNKWEDVLDVAATDLGVYADNKLIRRDGDEKVYILENGQKRWVPTLEIFLRQGLDGTKIAPINDTEFSVYPEGPALR